VALVPQSMTREVEVVVVKLYLQPLLYQRVLITYLLVLVVLPTRMVQMDLQELVQLLQLVHQQLTQLLSMCLHMEGEEEEGVTRVAPIIIMDPVEVVLS